MDALIRHFLPDDAEFSPQDETGQSDEEETDEEEGYGDQPAKERPGCDLSVSDCSYRWRQSVFALFHGRSRDGLEVTH